jgi:hypothetical protein
MTVAKTTPARGVMPANVRAGQVVEVMGGLSSSIDIPKLADELSGDLATFLPILDAAEMLGLVNVAEGDVSLTESGLRFQKPRRKRYGF